MTMQSINVKIENPHHAGQIPWQQFESSSLSSLAPCLILATLRALQFEADFPQVFDI